jgi:hypothetical protein
MSARLPEPMSLGRYRVLLAVLVVAAVVAFVAMIRSTDTGGPDAATAASDVVEQLVPNAGDEVLRQAELGVDLAPGYDGTLFVNGVEIPLEDQRRVPEQNQMFFTPGEGKAIERLPAGANCAMALVWKASDGRGTSRDRSFPWCFKAT